MTDKEQIEQMVDKIQLWREGICIDGCKGTVGSTAYQIAEDLYNAGYHKTIWHKVADGDLPKNYRKVAFIATNYEYYIGTYIKKDEAFETYIGFGMSKDHVIAWIELPEYKE